MKYSKAVCVVLIFLFMSALLLCGWSANPQSQSEEQKELSVPQLNKLISEIHSDLLLLKDKHELLSGYSDKCFRGGRKIFYLPKPIKETEIMPQQPDQFFIGYIPIDAKKEFKYDNDVESEVACQFPSFNSKIYAHLVLRGKENEQLLKEIKEIIVKRCNDLQKEIKEK